MHRNNVPKVVQEGDKEPWLFHERRGHDETAILGHEEYLEKMDSADPRLEVGDESVYDPIRRQNACTLNRETIYTKIFTSLKFPMFSIRFSHRCVAPLST